MTCVIRGGRGRNGSREGLGDEGLHVLKGERTGLMLIRFTVAIVTTPITMNGVSSLEQKMNIPHHSCTWPCCNINFLPSL